MSVRLGPSRFGDPPGFTGRIACRMACPMRQRLRLRRLVETGHVREAVEILLATAQFGRDLRHNGLVVSELYGRAICWIAFDELRDMILSGKVDRERLLDVDRGLEVLDRSFTQGGSCLRNQALAIGRCFFEVEDLQGETSLRGSGPVTIQASCAKPIPRSSFRPRFLSTRGLVQNAWQMRSSGSYVESDGSWTKSRPSPRLPTRTVLQ